MKTLKITMDNLGAVLRWVRRLATFEVRYAVDAYLSGCWELWDDGFSAKATALAKMHQRIHEHRRDPRDLKWRVRREIILRTDYYPAKSSNI